MSPLELVLERLERVVKSGAGFSARCPAHHDRKASLSVAEGEDGRVLLTCHAGCGLSAILEAADLRLRDLFATDAPRSGQPRGREIARYVYVDAVGQPVGCVVRFEPKGFAQQRPDGRSGWLWGLDGAMLPLYRLPDVAAAKAGGVVFLCEGEKDADALAALGLTATTTPGGAGKEWQPAWSVPLEGRRVVVLPDNDGPGRDHAEKVAAALEGVALKVRVLALPDLPDKGDVSDWLAFGGTSDLLLGLAAAAPVWESTREERPAPSDAREWPRLDEAALFGWPGDVVRAIDPHTEADPALVLATALVAGGNLLGRAPCVYVGDTPHRCNLNAAGVGETGKSRKGTSLGSVRRFAVEADDLWADCEKGGLSSGEGLIWAVRDPIEQTRPVREKGRTVDSETVVVDEGVADKRLLCVEEELAAVLKAGGRDGATLSETIRKAWDGRDVLRTMTKNSPAVATGAHVSVLAHITFDELRVTLTDTERANGLANRYLWFAARRSKCLPEPTRLDDTVVAELAGRLAAAKRSATGTGVFRRTANARALWSHVYPELSAGVPGLVGAILGRAEAQVLRLSLTYAALSGAKVIWTDHLLAALALWDYCEASVSLIFRDATGDATADRLLAAIRAAGTLDRTAAFELFGRHVNAARLDHALERLVTAGRIEVVREPTAGRPRTSYRARSVKPGGGHDFAGMARAWLAANTPAPGGEESEESEQSAGTTSGPGERVSSHSSLSSPHAGVERPMWKRCGCGERVPWGKHCPRCRPSGARLTA